MTACSRLGMDVASLSKNCRPTSQLLPLPFFSSPEVDGSQAVQFPSLSKSGAMTAHTFSTVFRSGLLRAHSRTVLSSGVLSVRSWSNGQASRVLGSAVLNQTPSYSLAVKTVAFSWGSCLLHNDTGRTDCPQFFHQAPNAKQPNKHNPSSHTTIAKPTAKQNKKVQYKTSIFCVLHIQQNTKCLPHWTDPTIKHIKYDEHWSMIARTHMEFLALPRFQGYLFRCVSLVLCGRSSCVDDGLQPAGHGCR